MAKQFLNWWQCHEAIPIDRYHHHEAFTQFPGTGDTKLISSFLQEFQVQQMETQVNEHKCGATRIKATGSPALIRVTLGGGKHH